ncbi:MAG: carbohydrate ABC transporter permease [Massiliimalia sp.]|jgi:ABC-type glycerol-3-phosphate transport system permease component
MKKPLSKRFSFSQLIITLFLIVSCVLAIFPLFYALSLSFQDSNAIYNIPPKFLPSQGQNMVIRTVYDEPVSEEALKQDAAVALFSAYFENRNKGIDKYYVQASVDDKVIFETEAHDMLLQLEMDYGTYKNTMIAQEVLISNDRCQKVMDKIGYEYNPDGISNPGEWDGKESELSQNVEALYAADGKYQLAANQVDVTTGEASFLAKLENYKYYFQLPQYMYQDYPFVKQYGFFAFMFNTILTVLVATVCQITIPAITAYPLAILFSKKLANWLMTFFLITMMVPFVCVMIPQLVLIKDLGLYDTYGAMLLPWLVPAPFYIFLYKGFFERIPKSYFEAAEIDGAGALYTFFNICLPLCKPIISLIAIQSFISGWTDFFWYFISTKNIDLWTLNLAMYNISNLAKTNFVMGLSVVIILPVVIVAVIFSKQIKQSVVGAGVKG